MENIEYDKNQIINEKLSLLASTIHFMTEEERKKLGYNEKISCSPCLADYRLKKINGEVFAFLQNRGFFSQPKYRYDELIVFPYRVLKSILNISYLDRLAQGKKYTLNFGTFPQNDECRKLAVDIKDLDVNIYKFGNNKFKVSEYKGKAALTALIKNGEHSIEYPVYIQDIYWDVYPKEGLVVSKTPLFGRNIWKNATKVTIPHDTLWDTVYYERIKASKPIFNTTKRDNKYLHEDFIRLIADNKTKGYFENDVADKVESLIRKARIATCRFNDLSLKAERFIAKFEEKIKKLLNIEPLEGRESYDKLIGILTAEGPDTNIYDEYIASCDKLIFKLEEVIKEAESRIEYNRKSRSSYLNDVRGKSRTKISVRTNNSDENKKIR